MRNALAVYTREIKSYFVSPIFYVIATVFMLVVGNVFKDNFFNFSTETMQLLRRVSNYGGEIPMRNINMVATNVFTFMNFLFLLIVPLLTMRLYAEEKKTGTMELLMTSPITTAQVLIGKFLSCLTIYVLMMLLTLAFMIIMMIQSNGKLDWGPVLSSYLGSLLLGCAIISIGMFFSSLTENQIVAATVSISFFMGLWLLVFSARFLAPPFNELVRYLSLSEHLDSFVQGFIGIKHIAYYLSMTIFWLFLTGINVESARWRQ
ncbi:ABC transporter permease [bacterium]|nr:ABC transporter permease [bacterium]